MKNYVTLGVDEEGYVYGLELDASEKGGFRHNELGYSTSCGVIRPVGDRTLYYMREDPESVLETWQAAVAADRTRLGLDDFFEECKSEYGSCFSDEEAWPFKDESWCWEIMMDDDNPAIKAFNELRDSEIEKYDPDNDEDDESQWYDDAGAPLSFQQYVERRIEEEIGLPGFIDGYSIGTWEAAGWWTPKKPFAIELAPREILDAYYAHLAEKEPEFKKAMEERNEQKREEAGDAVP